ncbi:hypothetical protein PybrP1_008248 [[Pythium] brassicae (nom. inval.)]|nr:hypothetical protein PybrP1_008248 [[Pythium] brassicae (nom. inval.)]
MLDTQQPSAMTTTMTTTTVALRWLLSAYRAMLPVKVLVTHMKEQLTDESDGGHWSSLEVQALVLDYVLRDPVCDDFPPHKTYVYRFLKSYVSELHDELVAELMEFVLHARVGDVVLSPEDLHHVSYTIPASGQRSENDLVPASPGALVVTCRVASVINEVGLKIWQAGWYLAEYVITHPEVFEDKTVLELGAGVGFTGLVLAQVARPKRVVLSDYAARVMQNLRYNTEVNASRFQCPVDVVTLDWESWDPSTADAELHPDVLLAGDCVYDVAAFPHLVRVLQVFLRLPVATAAEHRALSGARASAARDAETPQPERKAIFAATIRNQKTFQAFLDHLALFAIAYEDVTAAALARMGAQMFPYQDREQIRLCALTRAS